MAEDAHVVVQVNVAPDTDPPNPRTSYDNLGTMVCFHRRYTLGDVGGAIKGSRHQWNNTVDDAQEFKVWIEQQIKRGDVVALPLYLLDHSGITMSTDPDRFRAVDSHGWDWGQVGWIYATSETIRKEFSLKRNITKRKRALVGAVLQDEVELYDRYLCGGYYLYSVSDGNNDVVDSCCGFDDETCAKEEALRVATHYLREQLGLSEESKA